MSTIRILITLDTECVGNKLEVYPERDDIDRAVLCTKTTAALLKCAFSFMSANGLAKWQAVEAVRDFADQIEAVPMAKLAKSIRVADGGAR